MEPAMAKHWVAVDLALATPDLPSAPLQRSRCFSLRRMSGGRIATRSDCATHLARPNGETRRQYGIAQESGNRFVNAFCTNACPVRLIGGAQPAANASDRSTHPRCPNGHQTGINTSWIANHGSFAVGIFEPRTSGASELGRVSKLSADLSPSTLPMIAAADRLRSSIACEYTRSVKEGSECPSLPATVRTSTPAPISCVAVK